tara:strand:- start:27304 stop:27942 length:639 start_codon:yes stop_codon:yes gene_type:complete
MPNNLSIASVIEKNKLTSTVAYLILTKITIIDPATGLLVETLYLVKNTEDVIYDGQTYTAFAFDISTEDSVDGASSVSLTVTDYSQAIQARAEAYGGCVGSSVEIIIIASTSVGTSLKPEVTEFFEIISASAENYIISWTMGAEDILAQRFPRRKQMRDRCSWVYKGNECTYAGEVTTCDRSLLGDNGCQAHNNTINFGGFPGIRGTGLRYG